MKLKVLLGLLIAISLVCAQPLHEPGAGNPNAVDMPQLNAHFFTNPERPMAGEIFGAWIEVWNVGSVEFGGQVSAEIYVGEMDAPIASLEKNVHLPPGEQGRFQLENVGMAPPMGEYTITIKLGYTVDGRRVEKEFKDTIAVERGLGGEDGKLPDKADLGLVFILALVIVIVIIVILAYFLTKKKTPPVVAAPPQDDELTSLHKQRVEVEERIKIAKVKYYKRKLDEDSYKEIVKDNQEKLIEIEAKIGELQKRLTKLEINQSGK